MQLEPQHVDRNVSPIEYKQFGDKLLVTSVFHTIQGEGPWAGFVSSFARLAGCNFGRKASGTIMTDAGEVQVPDTCRFCDTFFAFAEGTPLTFDEILERIIQAQGDIPCNRIVITGGEPMTGVIAAAKKQQEQAAAQLQKDGARQQKAADSKAAVQAAIGALLGKHGSPPSTTSRSPMWSG